MKSILLIAIVYLLSTVNGQCGSGEVLNQQNICVKPNYIEGCYQYASDTKCNLCVFNYILGADGKCQYHP